MFAALLHANAVYCVQKCRLSTKYCIFSKINVYFFYFLLYNICIKRRGKNQMKCIYCGSMESKVVDSRQNEDGTSIRRRRECVVCGKRFTTYETVESTPIMVIKKDGSRQAFDLNKIKIGIMKACEKRPISMSSIDRLVGDIQRQVLNSLDQEVSSAALGDMVMEGLKSIDEVAYVRYASVHRQFKDINTLLDEIESLVKLKEEMTKKND